MPQLDASTFISQLFWLLVTFAILYLLMWRVVLPRIADLLQERQERMDDDLERAEALKNDAAGVLATYEKAVADGREKAHVVIREAVDRANASAAEQHATLAGQLAAEGEAAEARINAARDAALANVSQAAAEVAQAATARLVGGVVTEGDAESAVAAAVRDRG